MKNYPFETLQKNRHYAVVACHRVIRGIVKSVFLPNIKRIWRQNKDGFLAKPVQDKFNELVQHIIDFEVERINEKHNNLAGPAPIRVFPVSAEKERETICLQVRTSYKVSDHSNAYVTVYLYIGPNLTFSNLNEQYPLNSFETIKEQRDKIAEINKTVDSLREIQRDISRKYGYEYFN